MSAHILKADRNQFEYEGLEESKDTEVIDAFRSYFAYYGKYYEKEPGTIIHAVEGSLIPNWENKLQERYARIEGDSLFISTPPIQTEAHSLSFYLEWLRL